MWQCSGRGGNRMSRARSKSTAAQSISDQPEARIESDCGPQRAAVADYVWGVPRPTTMVSACRFALRTPPKGYVRRSFLSFEEGPGRHAVRAAAVRHARDVHDVQARYAGQHRVPLGRRVTT